MLISEKFLLMLLDEHKGKRYFEAASTKDLGLAGALLLDLYFKGKLAVERKRLQIIDYNTTEDSLLDEILVFLNDTKRPKKVSRWVERLAGLYKPYYLSFFRRMEEHGILSSEIKTTLKIFTSLRFHLEKPEVKQSIMEQISNVVINNMNPDIEMLALLGLMKSCGINKVYLVKKYKKLLNRKIEELLYSPNFDANDQNMILIVMKSIEEIITARVAAAVAASSAAAS